MQILTNAIIAYNPIKLFLLITYFAAAALAVSLVIDWIVAAGVHAGVIVLMGVSAVLVVFSMGLLGEALRRLR